MSVLAKPLEVARDSRHVPAPNSKAHGKIRILHVLNRLAPGGTENVVLQLAGGLDHEVFEHFILPLRGIDTALNAERVRERILRISARQNGFRLFAFDLAHAIRAYKPHIVHSRNWGAIEAIPAARFTGVPIAIHSEHGYELDMLAGLPSRRRIFRHAAYAMADTVFTVTRELREYHARQAWVPSRKIQILYNGVDTARFAPRPQVRRALRLKYGLPQNRFIVGTVGRMVPIKDHPTLLRAIELLARRGVDAHAVLVGAGPELDHYKSLVAGSQHLNGRVTFLGSSESVPEILNTIDVFTLTSISEGMSNTLLEAMASAVPVIATNVGGNSEVVEEGSCGWLIKTSDEEVLADRLNVLATQGDLRDAFGSAGRARAAQEFGLDRMLQSYTNLYLNLVAQRKVRVSDS